MDKKDNSVKLETRKRLYKLIDLQSKLDAEFGSRCYNVFVFGSYPTVYYREGESDVDLAVYTEDFGLYKKIAAYIEEYFTREKIETDIFYIDTTMTAPVYCAPLKSQVQLTDYYPEELKLFLGRCEEKLDTIKKSYL